MRALLVLILFAVSALALRAGPPRVAIAPVAREYLDGQESLGESLTPLLLAGLSGDPRWNLVERADLGPLEAEWSLGGSVAEQTALAVARGRMLGADWALLLHPDLRSPETPAIRIEIIDTFRSEPLDVRSVALRHRPRARWFRNPPGEDIDVLLAACREALARSLFIRTDRARSRVAAVMFFHPEPGSPAAPAFVAELEKHIATLGRADTAGRRDWRFLESPDLAVAHGEFLLRASGFLGDQAPVSPPVDALLWGAFRAADAEAPSLRFCIWSRQGEAREHLAQGAPVALAEAIMSALSATPSPPAEDPAPPAGDASRHALALRLVEEARALAPEARSGSPEADDCRRLLSLAALLAPGDRELQELRLIAARHALGSGPDISVARARIGLEYARLADHFWRGPDDHHDLRLLAASFLKTEHTLPGQRERAVRVAPLLARAPASALRPHAALFLQWPAYCRRPDAGSFALLETALPVISRFRPDRLRTSSEGFVGIVPTLLETYHHEDRARLLALVDALPGSPSAPDPMADAPERLRVADSPEPELPYPRFSPDGRLLPAKVRRSRSDVPVTPPARAEALPAPAAPDHEKNAPSKTPDGPALVAALARNDAAFLRDTPLTAELLAHRDPKLWTLLHHAIDRKDDDLALRLIEAGADIEAATSGGQTPLTFAAFKARPAVVRALLAKNASPQAPAAGGLPPLAGACVGDDTEIVRLLLEAGADPRATYDGGVPLILCAAQHSSPEIIGLLVERGATLDAIDRKGAGPLEVAFFQDNAAALAWLLDHRARWRSAARSEQTGPLLVAVRHRAWRCAHLLLERGEIDARALPLVGDPKFKAALEDKLQAAGSPALDDEELWPAICADRENWRARADAHLAKGGNVNYAGANWTPLIKAFYAGNIDLVRHLVAKGADPRKHPREQMYADMLTLAHLYQGTFGKPAHMDVPEFMAYRAELIRLLAPLEPSSEYEYFLTIATRMKRRFEIEAYVSVGTPTAQALSALERTPDLKDEERARLRALLVAPTPN